MADTAAILAKVKDQLASRGAKTIRGLGRVFNTYDSAGARRVDAQEFFVGLNDSGCGLSKEETDALLAHLDTNQDGNVDFDEFLRGIRGSPNATRQGCVDAAFSKFDVNGSGCVTASDLRVAYNAAAHPKVISGDITEDEAFLEFLSNFGDKNNDGQITVTEWNDYYSAVSASIDNDQHFTDLMKNAWGL